MRIGLLTLLVLALAIGGRACAQFGSPHPVPAIGNDTTKPFPKSIITTVVTDDSPADIAKRESMEQTFKNVKASHIFVCEDVSGEKLPNWLQPEALVTETLKYISEDRDPIEYADHQQHQPDERECKYDPVLEEPGNLNFIIKVRSGQLRMDGKPVQLATITRFIYRPDHRTSIQAFLGGVTFFYPLDDEPKARKAEESQHIFWGIGYSDEIEFNK